MRHAAAKVYRYLYRRFYIRLASLYNRVVRGEENIHLLHIGKTGGSALKEALLPVRKGRGYRIWFHKHDVSLADIPRGDKVIITIRDPISRFVSGFYSRKRQGKPKYNIPWSEEERRAFSIFRTPNELANALRSENREVREEALRAMRGIMHVNSFLRDWVISREYLLSRKEDILIVMSQENLDEDFEILKKILNLPEEINLPKDPTVAHKAPRDEDRDLDQTALQSLREWYEGDYELYETLLMIRSEILSKISSY